MISRRTRSCTRSGAQSNGYTTEAIEPRPSRARVLRVVRTNLESFVRDASQSERASWASSVPWFQGACRDLVECHEPARLYTAILEYRLPREMRRADVVVLENGIVVVLELKGKTAAVREDLDQVLAYARDLRCYHAACADRPVHAVLVPMRAGESRTLTDGVHVTGPAGVRPLLAELSRVPAETALTPDEFLDDDAYAPLPTLVQAARDLFQHGDLPYIKRARAATDPAVLRIVKIAREAAKTRTRRLVLLSGVPGSGKTLVGLRLVHGRFLDELAVPRAEPPLRTSAAPLPRTISEPPPRTIWDPTLNLDLELRFHLASRIHEFVEGLLRDTCPDDLPVLGDELWSAGHRFLLTLDLERASTYLRERYAGNRMARYGLLAWGTDLVRVDGVWSNRNARGSRDPVEDPLRLRKNSYRVLLTRGRDGTVLFVPDDRCLDDTVDHLLRCGVRWMENVPEETEAVRTV